MKNLWERVATVVLIVIGGVFVLVALLSLFGRLTIFNAQGALVVDDAILVLMSLLALAFLALSAYIMYRCFSTTVMLKEVVLNNDCCSSMRITKKAVQSAVEKCTSLVDGVEVTKIKLFPQPNCQVAIKIYVKLKGEISLLDKVRFMLEESFKKTLGYTFNTIEFEIAEFSNSFEPDQKSASENATLQNAQRKYMQDCLKNPIPQKEEEAEQNETVKIKQTKKTKQNQQ